MGLGRRIRATGGGQIRLTARVTGRRPVGPVAGDVRGARGSVGPLLIGGAGAARGGVRSVVARGVAAVLAQVLRRGTLQGFVRDAAAEGLAVLLWLAAGRTVCDIAAVHAGAVRLAGVDSPCVGRLLWRSLLDCGGPVGETRNIHHSGSVGCAHPCRDGGRAKSDLAGRSRLRPSSAAESAVSSPDRAPPTRLQLAA